MTTTGDSRTRSQPTQATAQAAGRHEHAWVTESRHRTAEGDVLYVRCGSCRARSIDLQMRSAAPPTALTKPIWSQPRSPMPR